MKGRFVRGARWALVTIGVIVLTSMTVDATLSGGGISQSALGILARSIENNGVATCAEGAVEVQFDGVVRCVDIFEASPSPLCPNTEVRSSADTRNNLDSVNCVPTSKKGANPWTFVTLGQAQELCARAGKALLTSEEWYRVSLGIVDGKDGTTCNVRGASPLPGGTTATCVSGAGLYDTIGNVWEWVDGEVVDGVFEGKEVPPGGYVAEADAKGFVTLTSETPNPDYHLDYFWSADEGTYGLLRGGFFGSGDDAGLYSIQAKTAPSFSGAAIGFRCIDNLQ